MKTITNKTFDEERSLYGVCDILVKDCAFDGPTEKALSRRDSRLRLKTAFSIFAIPSGMIMG